MPLYTFRCTGCGNHQQIVSSIKEYASRPQARCTLCRGELVRDYRSDKPQPAPMWPEHFNPSVGQVVRSKRQMQDALNRHADEQFERTGIPSRPVVVDRADMAEFKKPDKP